MVLGSSEKGTSLTSTINTAEDLKLNLKQSTKIPDISFPPRKISLQTPVKTPYRLATRLLGSQGPTTTAFYTHRALKQTWFS